jgi:predicted Zn finger-like uncharacterized protein
MFTVCPKCALTLVVTAADLRVAQGYVRCGRCSSVFNALARLSDDRQAGAAADESAALSSPEPTEPTESTDPSEPSEQADADLSPLDQALTQEDAERDTDTSAAAEEPIPEDALEFNPETTDVGAVFVEPPPNPQWTAATGSFKAMRAASEASTREVAEVPAEPAGEGGEPQVDVEIDSAFLADMLRDSAPQSEPQSEAEPTEVQPAAPTAPDPAAEREPPLPPIPARPASTASARAAPRHGGAHIRPPPEASVRRHGTAAHEHAPRTHQTPTVPSPAETTWTAPQGAADESGADEIAAEDTSARSVLARLDARAWAAGAALALLVLVAQIVNHNRDALAANSGLRRPLTALYHSLGVQLVPQWDLRAYDVRQLGASADPAGSGVITVRASIKNAGPKAQPLPLLRVTLQDRFGNRIAARDVAPRFYVPHSIPESSYLAGGQRIDAEMGFVDPGTNAVGFEIDACLPATGGGITCANDLAAR